MQHVMRPQMCQTQELESLTKNSHEMFLPQTQRSEDPLKRRRFKVVIVQEQGISNYLSISASGLSLQLHFTCYHQEHDSRYRYLKPNSSMTVLPINFAPLFFNFSKTTAVFVAASCVFSQCGLPKLVIVASTSNLQVSMQRNAT